MREKSKLKTGCIWHAGQQHCKGPSIFFFGNVTMLQFSWYYKVFTHVWSTVRHCSVSVCTLCNWSFQRKSCLFCFYTIKRDYTRVIKCIMTCKHEEEFYCVSFSRELVDLINLSSRRAEQLGQLKIGGQIFVFGKRVEENMKTAKKSCP